jgi:RNA polymerase sigma factor (sigma-70 family)
MTIDQLVVPVTRTPQIAADEAAVLSVHERRGQELFGFARRLGLSDEQAADAVQEAMLRMWRELHRGTVIDRPDAWAFRAVYRLAMDAHRWRRRLEQLLPKIGDRLTQPAETTTDPTDRLAVWSEVARLPARQREVLYLRYRADLPFDDVGAALGITANAARSHCSTALATLRRRFAADQEDAR